MISGKDKGAQSEYADVATDMVMDLYLRSMDMVVSLRGKRVEAAADGPG